jgi:hypothetical protein
MKLVHCELGKTDQVRLPLAYPRFIDTATDT